LSFTTTTKPASDGPLVADLTPPLIKYRLLRQHPSPVKNTRKVCRSAVVKSVPMTGGVVIWAALAELMAPMHLQREVRFSGERPHGCGKGRCIRRRHRKSRCDSRENNQFVHGVPPFGVAHRLFHDNPTHSRLKLTKLQNHQSRS